jgi:xanthine dehydrogenase accessory factor
MPCAAVFLCLFISVNTVIMARLDHILRAAKRLRVGERCVLATVIDLSGSGYRRPGARMLLMEDGEQVGAISGGCLERDVARSAWRWVEAGPQVVSFDTRADAFHPLGAYGTGCEGVVTVLLQQLPAPGTTDVLHELGLAQQAGEPAVVVHRFGAQIAQQVWWGGQLRAAGIDAQVARAAALERSLHPEPGAFIEYVPAPVELLAVGAGEDVAALMEVARPLGWRLRVASTDPVRLRDARFAHVDRHVLTQPAAVADLALGRATRVVLMTHSLTFDAEALGPLLASPARLVGVLGPASRTVRLMALLHAQGRLPGAAQLDKLRSPVGLDLGGEDAWEVAVSIIAQITAEAHDRPGGALHGRGGPIHPSPTVGS